MIVHGNSDKAVPFSKQSLDAALRKAGASSTLTAVKGAGHEFKDLRQGAAADAVNKTSGWNLNSSKHTRYWLGKIDTPADAWVDPIISRARGHALRDLSCAFSGPRQDGQLSDLSSAGYDKAPAKRYPVIYYLHGGSGSSRVGDIWVQNWMPRSRPAFARP